MNRLFVTSTRLPAFEAPGIAIVHVPLLVPRCLPVSPLPEFRTAVFFSRNAVDCAARLNVDWREVDIWSVGEGTADAVHEALGVVSSIPTQQDFAGIVAAFRHESPSEPILAFEIADGPRSLQDALPHLDVRQVTVYETKIETSVRLKELSAGDGLLIASPRAIEGIRASLLARSLSDLERGGVHVGVIGPTTRDAAIEAGVAHPLMTTPPSLEALCRTMVEAMQRSQDH